MATAKQRYEHLIRYRDQFEDTGRRLSALTKVPYRKSSEQYDSHRRLPQSYQSTGAMGAQSISAKIALAMFPTTAPWFGLSLDEILQQKLLESQGVAPETPEAKKFSSALELDFNMIIRTVMTEIRAKKMRSVLEVALQQLFAVAGPLLYLDEENKLVLYTLDKYGLRRDKRGEMAEVVVCEHFMCDTLDEDVRDFAMKAMPEKFATDQSGQSKDKDIPVYTWVRKERNKAGKLIWVQTQEINGMEIPDTRSEYPEALPWFAPRVKIEPNEDFARPYAEYAEADMRAYDRLRKALIEAAAQQSQVRWMVRSGSRTRIKTLSSSRNGDFIPGDPEDISPLQVNKGADLSSAYQQAQEIKMDLEKYFLMGVAVRDAERVTAEEIRTLNREINSSLGSVISVLTDELAQPLIEAIMWRMRKDKRIPDIKNEEAQPNILTGIESISRGQDVNDLNSFMSAAGQVGQFDPTAVQKINFSEFLTRYAAAFNIDTKNLIRSDEEVANMNQQAQMQQMAEQLGPEAMKMIRDQVDPGKE